MSYNFTNNKIKRSLLSFPGKFTSMVVKSLNYTPVQFPAGEAFERVPLKSTTMSWQF